MLALVLDAAVLGGIVAVMEQDEFPGWIRTALCAIAISLAMFAAASVLPGLLALLGFVVGAVVGAFAISALCGMSVKRGFIAASVFLGYKLLLFFLCLGLMAGSGSGGTE